MTFMVSLVWEFAPFIMSGISYLSKKKWKKITKDFSTEDALNPHLSLSLVKPLHLDYAESDEVMSPIVGFIVIWTSEFGLLRMFD